MRLQAAAGGIGWCFNLAPQMASLPTGISPKLAGINFAKVEQTRTDFGTSVYGGPCPPVGDKPHHYLFTLYALKDKIPLDSTATAAMVGFYANQMALAKATLTGLYSR